MPFAGSVITKKLPGNVDTWAHVVPTQHLLSGYATGFTYEFERANWGDSYHPSERVVQIVQSINENVIIFKVLRF